MTVGADPAGTAAPQAAVPDELPRNRLARIWAVSAIPLAAIALALVFGSLVMLASSVFAAGEFDPTLPFRAFGALGEGAFVGNGLVNTIVAATPLVLGGLAVGIAFKAGLFNIGAQGQFLIGGFASAVVGASLAGAPGPLAVTIGVLAGALAGLLYGFVPGALKAWTGAHEVVTTIMLNYIAVFLIAYLVSDPLRAEGFTFPRTGDLGNAELPVLLGRSGHIGILFAVAAVPLAWWLLWRTTIGFEIRTVGANPNAARYAGMRPARLTILTMALCGMLAGLAGAGQILGVTGFMSATYGTSVGFDSIAVALLGRAHPVGILFSALLFGAMRAGAPLMQIETDVPIEIIDIIQAVILLFLAADVIVRKVLRLRAARAGVDEAQTVTRSYGEQAAR